MLSNVVGILGIGLEANLARTARTPDVEAVDAQPWTHVMVMHHNIADARTEVVLIEDGLLRGVELLALVDVLATRQASHVVRLRGV